MVNNTVSIDDLFDAIDETFPLDVLYVGRALHPQDVDPRGRDWVAATVIVLAKRLFPTANQESVRAAALWCLSDNHDAPPSSAEDDTPRKD